MMTVKEYAQDTGHSIAEILKKCNELGINVKSGDDDLSEDDIIILDNTINLISTDVETDYEDEDALEEALVYQGVAAFPARMKCATIAWKAVEEILGEEDE